MKCNFVDIVCHTCKERRHITREYISKSIHGWPVRNIRHVEENQESLEYYDLMFALRNEAST